MEQPLRYYENNLISAMNLASAMRTSSTCKRLIFSSSATVYGSGSAPPFSEASLVGVGITNPYGWTKFMLEQILSDVARAEPEMSLVLLRYFNPVGAHESGRIGEDPAGRPNNLMPFVLQVAVGRRDKLTIHGGDYETADGTAERDYVHVMDLASGHLAALEWLLRDGGARRGTEIFNLGSGTPVSVRQIVTAMSTILGHDLPHEVGPRRLGDLPCVYSVVDRAREVLGWTATHSLDDMCRDGLRWQRANPFGYRSEEEARALEHSK